MAIGGLRNDAAGTGWVPSHDSGCHHGQPPSGQEPVRYLPLSQVLVRHIKDQREYGLMTEFQQSRRGEDPPLQAFR